MMTVKNHCIRRSKKMATVERHPISRNREITNRLVRGRHAFDYREVRFYRIGVCAEAASAAVTGIGVGSFFLALLYGDRPPQSVPTVAASFHGLSLVVFAVGAATYVAYAVIQKLISSGNVEKKTGKAMAVYEAMRCVHVQSQDRLEVPDPLSQSSQLHDDVIFLGNNNYHVMPEYEKYNAEGNLLAAVIITNFCDYWGNKAHAIERRGRYVDKARQVFR